MNGREYSGVRGWQGTVKRDDLKVGNYEVLQYAWSFQYIEAIAFLATEFKCQSKCIKLRSAKGSGRIDIEGE